MNEGRKGERYRYNFVYSRDDDLGSYMNQHASDDQARRSGRTRAVIIFIPYSDENIITELDEA